jgi:hypothetical protein
MLAAAGARILVASALAAGAGWSAATLLERSGLGGAGGAGLMGRALVVAAGMSAAAVVYLTAATVLKIQEMKSVSDTAARIFGRGRGGGAE